MRTRDKTSRERCGMEVSRLYFVFKGLWLESWFHPTFGLSQKSGFKALKCLKDQKEVSSKRAHVQNQ